ncbi:MAG: hypothetical protein COU45_02955, partial [Nitrosopumilus sp. CG10_big_fil_rev_8_21_14_0_10_33_7]
MTGVTVAPPVILLIAVAISRRKFHMSMPLFLSCPIVLRMLSGYVAFVMPDVPTLAPPGPGDFYSPGEARGQLYYQYGSKVFSTLAKSTNEVLDTEQDSILWAKSRATATASFESTNFNEMQYTISTKNLPNIVRISLYLGDPYTNSEIRLIDIPYTVNPFKPNSDIITGKLTNDDMCKISHEEHGFASHAGHTMTEDETTSHDGYIMDEEGIISHDQHSSHNESNTCYGVNCVDPEPKEFLVALVDGS